MPSSAFQIPTKLSTLAGQQHGLMTHAQAIEAGLSRTRISMLVRSGVWQQVRPRVFRRMAKSQTEEQSLLATCFWLGKSAVVSHRSAARLLGLKLEQGDLEVTTLLGQGNAAPGLICHRSKAMSPDDRKLHRGIPVTTGARTIIDLASCLDEEDLAIMVEEAWRKKIASPAWVKSRLKELRGSGRHTGALSEILADCDRRETALESALEVRVWRLLRKARLPVPRNSYPFSDDCGQPCRIDLAYPEQHLAIEADGYEHHGTRDAFEVDRLRTSRLAAQGWRLIQVTSKQLDEQPAGVVQRVREALRYRTS